MIFKVPSNPSHSMIIGHAKNIRLFLLLLAVCLSLLVSAEMSLTCSCDTEKNLLILSAWVILFFTF